MTDAALLKRIDRLEARAEIAELCADYAQASDDRDMDLLSSCFADDAWMSSKDGMMNCQGKDGIVKMFEGRFAVLGPSYHWTHDHKVRFDDNDPDKAYGLVFGHAEVFRNKQTLVAAMRYNDEYKRVNGKWLFKSRTLSFFYYVPVEEFKEALGSTLRQRAYGEKRKADFPEGLACYEASRAKAVA
jgi:uncharacterized protein (TIGR02246 family)